MENKKQPIREYREYKDLIVYQNLYAAMLIILKEIIPKLPAEEKYDLCDQMRRCCKTMPALVAESFAKRYQKRSWHKYLEDVLGEINEIQNHLDVCIDVYGRFVDINKCREAKVLYKVCGNQAYKLKESWKNFHDERQ